MVSAGSHGCGSWTWNSQDCSTLGTFPRAPGRAVAGKGGLEPVQGAELPWGSFWGSSEPFSGKLEPSRCLQSREKLAVGAWAGQAWDCPLPGQEKGRGGQRTQPTAIPAPLPQCLGLGHIHGSRMVLGQAPTAGDAPQGALPVGSSWPCCSRGTGRALSTLLLWPAPPLSLWTSDVPRCGQGPALQEI